MLHYIEVRKLYLLICGHYTIHRLGLLGIKTTPTRNRLHCKYIQLKLGHAEKSVQVTMTGKIDTLLLLKSKYLLRLNHLYKETLKLEAFSVMMSFEFDNEIKKVEDSKEKLWDGQKK